MEVVGAQLQKIRIRSKSMMYLVSSFRGSRFYLSHAKKWGWACGGRGCDLLLGPIMALCSCHVPSRVIYMLKVPALLDMGVVGKAGGM